MHPPLFVLFVCEYNSARSQMAKTFLQDLGGADLFVVESCGLEAGKINPDVIKVMKEIGYDISANLSQTAIDLLKEGRIFDIVIYVCSHEVKEKCPIIPGKSIVLHWPFDDPGKVQGSEEQRLRSIRIIRDQIKNKIEVFLQNYKNQGANSFLSNE